MKNHLVKLISLLGRRHTPEKIANKPHSRPQTVTISCSLRIHIKFQVSFVRRTMVDQMYTKASIISIVDEIHATIRNRFPSFTLSTGGSTKKCASRLGKASVAAEYDNLRNIHNFSDVRKSSASNFKHPVRKLAIPINSHCGSRIGELPG